MNYFRQLMNRHRRQVFFICSALVLLAAIVFITAHNDRFYHATIAKVTHIEDRFLKSEKGPNGEIEKYFRQELTLTVKNGSEQGRTAAAENIYARSLVSSERYRTGDKLFVTLSTVGGTLRAEITGVKRDAYAAFLLGAFVLGLLFISKNQGLLTLLSFCINITVFIGAVVLYIRGRDITLLCIAAVFIFCTVTLLLSAGLKAKTFGAILSTFVTLSVTFLLYRLVTAFLGEPPYQHMDYVFGPNDIESIFLAGILIGCLGAVMDVAITVHSAVSELLLTAENLTMKMLIRSIREIGYDIMGTMINVLLFSYISGSLPMIVLKIVNGYSLFSLVKFNIIFELVRFLVGSIGIVLAIPISGIISVLFAQRGKLKC